MDLATTLALGGALLALALASAWLGARPPNPHRGPRMVPWRFLMVLAAAAVVVMLVHLVNLLGITTGH